ncbi:hypothetical protein [Roseibium sediminis]|uniref:hypothetical protein n=1 Tax=Roseibium sediminis TaxID=1775174 RepID=UPI00123E35CD|nr:hypothetical protein [Roseibium sediminis]
MPDPQGILAGAMRTLQPYKDAPREGEWLVCENGHVIAQYIQKEATGLKDWGRFLGGCTIDHKNGRRRITCGICGGVSLNQSIHGFVCRVVPDKAVKMAVQAVGA